MREQKKSPGKYWWAMPEERAHEAIFPILKNIRQNQSQRSSRNLLHMRLYGNMDIAGLEYRNIFSDNSPKPNAKIKINICKSGVDTLVSKLSKVKTRPLYLAKGGNWSLSRRAIKTNLFMEGLFNHLKIYQKGAQVLTDAGIFDIGAMKFIAKKGKIECERVFPEEILVDDLDGFHGNPKSLFQIKPVSRDILLSTNDYRKKWKEIENLPRMKSATSATDLSDLVVCSEAWHLPTEDGKGGKRVISVENATLVEEAWDLDTFPFAFQRFSKRQTGWYGQGAVEQLVGYQIEINKVLKTAQESLAWSVPKVFIEAGSKIVPVSNAIMGHSKFTGKPPIIEALRTLPPDLLPWVDMLIRRAFDQIGISELSAQSRKPSGLDSGKALREYIDIESDRHNTLQDSYEDFYLDASEICMKLVRKVAKEDSNFAVKVKSKYGVDFVKWKDASLEDNEYELDKYGANLLPRTPAGRLATVQDMLATQMIDIDEARKLMDYPDYESVTNYKNAPYEIMDKIIEQILDGAKKVKGPDPIMNLDKIGIPRMQLAYNKAEVDGAPEDVLDKMRTWIKQAKNILNPPPPTDPEAMPLPDQGELPPPGGMPMADGAMPPGMPQDPSMMAPPMPPPGAGPI